MTQLTQQQEVKIKELLQEIDAAYTAAGSKD